MSSWGSDVSRVYRRTVEEGLEPDCGEVRLVKRNEADRHREGERGLVQTLGGSRRARKRHAQARPTVL